MTTATTNTVTRFVVGRKYSVSYYCEFAEQMVKLTYEINNRTNNIHSKNDVWMFDGKFGKRTKVTVIDGVETFTDRVTGVTITANDMVVTVKGKSVKQSDIKDCVAVCEELGIDANTATDVIVENDADPAKVHRALTKKEVPTLTYRQLQIILKVERLAGNVDKTFKLNQKKVVLQAKYAELVNAGILTAA